MGNDHNVDRRRTTSTDDDVDGQRRRCKGTTTTLTDIRETTVSDVNVEGRTTKIIIRNLWLELKLVV